VNEAREKHELKPLEGGDSPNNATFVQAKNAAMMAEQQQQNGMFENDGEPEIKNSFEEVSEKNDDTTNPFDLYNVDEDDDDTNKGELENSFVKAFDNFLKQEGI
ncbi:MAG: hypothetical protein PHS04_02685, partial [Tissierellia bacterium]|nr:hypothetical protein [Tissierellia bacterium]